MANWYYAWLGEQVGPVQQEDFEGLIEAGTVSPDTLVWREGMAEWQRLAEVEHLLAEAVPEAAGAAVEVAAEPGVSSGEAESTSAEPRQRCVECGLRFDPGEMIVYGGSFICAGCKPLFFQRVREGADLPGKLNYAGFWIRFGAKLIDGVILWVVSAAFGMVSAAIGLAAGNMAVQLVVQVVLTLLQIAVGIAYNTYFVGRFGATPGKMACGLRVVRSDGSRVSYWRAFGRYFGEVVSTLIIFIGYVIAAFDEEKRTLHDRMCDTRVVHR